MNSAMVLDFYDMQKVGELGFFKKLLMEGALPEFVKNASVEFPKNATNKDFALIINKQPKFPIDSKANTYLSKLSFEINKDKLPRTARDMAAFWLTKAASVYGLESNLKPSGQYETNQFFKETDIIGTMKEEAASKLAAKEKELEQSYALEWNGRKLFPLNDEGQVKEAKVAFEKDYRKLTPMKRREMAQKIFEKCAELKINVDDSDIMKYAGTEFSSFLPQRIKIRKRYLSKKAARGLEQLYEAKDIFGPKGFAEVLSEFDKAAKIDRLYNTTIPDAYYTVFCDPCSMEKLGYSLETIYGKITEKELRTISEHEKVAKLFGDEFAAEFRSSPVTIFETLPLAEKNIMADLIKTENLI